MSFDSSNRRGKSPPRAPPSSPMHAQYRRQHEPLQQQRIANLLQYAQSSYQTNPTDALGALMNALTISAAGNNAAADHALGRIREELGDAVADCVAGNGGNNIGTGSSYRRGNNNMQQQQHQQQSSPHLSNASSHNLSEREMIRAMAVVEGLLKDESTILYAQGKSHILQHAMEDGSSVVCTKCGDMIARERWQQHAEFWCRAMDEKSCDGANGDMKIDE